MVKRSDKVLLIVIGGILALGGLCAVCLGAGILLPYHFWTQGGAAQAAKRFLAADPVLLEHLGAIKDFGLFPSGSVNEVNGRGQARLEFSLKGEKADGRALVDLIKEPRGDWRVTSATLYVGTQELRLKGEAPDTARPRQLPESPSSPSDRAGSLST